MKNLTAFILLVLAFNASLGQKVEDCKIYHKGYFEFDGKHSNVLIYRNEDYQIEYNIESGEWVIIELNWKSVCDYSFTYLHTNMDALKKYIGHSVEVEILSGDSTGYDYRAIYRQGGKVFDGRVVFSTREQSKSKRKKIVKLLERKTSHN